MGHPKIITRPTPMLRKQVGQMAKLFGLWNNSKLKDSVKMKVNPQPVMREGVPEFLSQTRGVRTKHVTRRQIVLNRHFTEIISDVLAINFGTELNKLGITISSIETKAWNKGVRVFYTRDDSYDEHVHKELIKFEAPLRYTISQRRLIGRVPSVNFVYDSSLQFDKVLVKALSKASLDDRIDEEEKALTKTAAEQLYVLKDLGVQEERLVSRKFSAPANMNNTIFGLNYPELYDEVATKLARGRADASRFNASKTYITSAKPLFREPLPANSPTDEDPYSRILSMRKFIISQKQKAEIKARKRRKEELLERNKYKWVETESSENKDDGIAPNIADET